MTGSTTYEGIRYDLRHLSELFQPIHMAGSASGPLHVALVLLHSMECVCNNFRSLFLCWRNGNESGIVRQKQRVPAGSCT